ncbi:MAG TPA: DUF4198 domain-containing protein [Rhizobacter sp.]|nr:DUF4198 domain-containing protein [Rhizobacter sp.]
MNLTRLSLALLAAAALLPTAAHAHRTWLLPSATVVSGKEPTVVVDAAVSEDLFEYDTNALALDGLSITAPDGGKSKPEAVTTTRRRNSFDFKPTQPGTYRIVNFSESAMASYKLGGETKRWRGSLEAMAKEIPANAEELQVTRTQARVETYVTYEQDDKRPVAPSFAPQGTGLELIPLSAPTDLSVGDTSSFRLLIDGQPAANIDVTLIRGGNRYRYKMGEIALKTDAQGQFSVKWPEAGRYWIGANTGGRGPGGTAAQPARRASLSATVEVLPD